MPLGLRPTLHLRLASVLEVVMRPLSRERVAELSVEIPKLLRPLAAMGTSRAKREEASSKAGQAVYSRSAGGRNCGFIDGESDRSRPRRHRARRREERRG